MTQILRYGVQKRWSDVVCHGGVAYFVEVPENPNLPPPGQFMQVLQQTAQTLISVGSSPSRMLQVMVYLPFPEDLEEFNRQWDAWVPEGHAPSRACVHAQLAAPEYRVELVITAALKRDPSDSAIL